MFEQNYENLLKQITIQAIAKLVGGNDNISNLLFALTQAAASRQIVAHVQFEDGYQCQLDNSDTWYVLSTFKLAPHLCEIAYSNGEKLNEASWEFALPNVNTLAAGDIPENTIDYLSMGTILVDSEDDEDYTYSCLSNVLESIGDQRID